jgi:integrase
MLLEELERRNYSAGTIRYYVRFVEGFAQHFGKSPDKLGLEEVRSYQSYPLKQRKVSPGSVEHHVSALRFFLVQTPHRHEFRQFLPFPRTRRNLPKILSREGVARLIDASNSPFERTPLMVLYGTGMRRSEVARLKIADIDSPRMVIHVVNGKGNNWNSIGPDLRGKIHLVAGTDDTFYLDGAAHSLESALNRLGGQPHFTFLPGRSHFNVYVVGDDRFAIFDQIAAEMYQVARPARPKQ